MIHRLLAFIIAVVVLMAWIYPVQAEDNAPAEVMLSGGAIYTMDAARSWADTIAIAGGRIIYVGTEKGAQRLMGPDTKVIDLAGRMVLPGFHDSHIHPVMGGVNQFRCKLDGLGEKEMYTAIAAYVKEHPRQRWILGGGWSPPAFTGGVPHKKAIDTIIPDRPALFYSEDVHSIWVNSAALTCAGITRDTPDPEGGRIVRDASGEPVGVFYEKAMELVVKHVPPSSPDELVEGAKKALSIANGFGITSLYEAAANEEILRAYQALDTQGKLTARITASVKLEPAGGEHEIQRLKELKARYHGRYLSIAGAKIFLDGIMESHTAALIKPYLDRPGDCGELLVSPEKLSETVTALDAEGFQVHIHTIGDKAIHTGLDAFEASLKKNGFTDRRHHMAHLQLVDPGDIPRLRELGVAANFQPLWAFASPNIVEMTEPALGPERSRWLYPIGSNLRSGAVVAAGSDWNVSSMNPLDAITVAVTRCIPYSQGGTPWIPGERVDLAEILAAYTINGAYLTHREKETGSLEAGKSADLVVLDRNLFTVTPGEICRTRVLLTMLAGKIVFERDARK